MLDSEVNNEQQNQAKTIFILIIYCLSGSLLTIVNKLAITIFPFTNLLLFLQNGVTVVLLIINYSFTSTTLPSITMEIVQLWIPVVSLFVIMLLSSLFALIYVSVPTVIVIRNLSTLSVAVLEYFMLGNTITTLSIGTLLGMLLGAIFYALHDLTFSIHGYLWLCVNIIGTSVYQVYIKKIVHLPLVKDCGSVGMSYYNNLISLPIFLILAGLMGEMKGVWLYSQLITMINLKSLTIVFISCVFGFMLSVSAFALNKLISATSIMVANNVNKFALIVLSELLVESTLDLTASIGAVFVLLFGWLYSQTKENYAKSVFIILFVIFISSYVSLELRNTILPVFHSTMLSRFSWTQTININSTNKIVNGLLNMTINTQNQSSLIGQNRMNG